MHLQKFELSTGILKSFIQLLQGIYKHRVLRNKYILSVFWY